MAYTKGTTSTKWLKSTSSFCSDRSRTHSGYSGLCRSRPQTTSAKAFADDASVLRRAVDIASGRSQNVKQPKRASRRGEESSVKIQSPPCQNHRVDCMMQVRPASCTATARLVASRCQQSCFHSLPSMTVEIGSTMDTRKVLHFYFSFLELRKTHRGTNVYLLRRL